MSEWKPKHFVQSIRWPHPSAFVLRIDRCDLEFRAGQCISLGVWGSGVNREYSLYSGERESYLEVLCKLIREGTVTPALARLEPGAPVYVAGPYSDFVLPEPVEPKPTFLFIATGTGIAPFHSFVASQPSIDYTIIHGVRSGDETYDRHHYDAGRYVACVSRERSEGAFHGRVTDFLRTRPAQAGAKVYLCGNHAMIEEAFELLRQKGVSADNIHSEVFF